MAAGDHHRAVCRDAHSSRDCRRRCGFPVQQGSAFLPFQHGTGGGRFAQRSAGRGEELFGIAQVYRGRLRYGDRGAGCAPPLIQCAVWSLGLALCGAAAELFSLGEIGSLLRAAQTVVKTLVAVLAACSLFMIIATAIVTTAGGAAA